ncbi:11-beta-hydroxysteroid dehydrogenase 1A [Forsythia ovata]|uniref:11-beta-hydroxysteroid dehydrogenase 1A n=1 Tax=Forsythia ovata TaxID=205694 RepID=A0ABD1TQT0_9LAMI
MDLIHQFLNLVAPPFTFFTLLFFLPPFLFFKFFLSLLATIFSEDVAGKVVLITGASSGIGEHLAYEYAKRGACLVLAARRERSLQEVAERARDLGSPDVLVVRTDVSRVEDCRNASKAAIAQFFETLRIEFGPDIGITLVTPGFIESELTQGKFMGEAGKLEVDQDIRDVQVSIIPVQRVESCARGIVSSACKGEKYVTEPAWFRVTFLWKIFCPELIEWTYRLLYITRPEESPKDALGKKLVDFTGAKKFLYPETIQVPDLKKD